MAKAKAAKTKVVKAKVTKVKPKKRMSKGVLYPWEVWHLFIPWASNRPQKFHSLDDEFKTEKQAKAYMEKSPELIAPVIRHVEIPPMEY